MQRFAFGANAKFAAQPDLHSIELRELLISTSSLVVGDIIRRTRKTIERQDCRAQLGPDQSGSYRKVLVPVTVARREVDGCFHAPPFMAWTRSFHRPPRPRQTAKANCTVNSV